MDTHAQPPEKALLVEDTDIIQKIHRLYLEELGFEVDLAETGYEALRLADQQDYHCILLDIGLPDISGESVLSAIRYRERKTGKRLPIIVNSAAADETIFQRCRERGADATLQKPLMPDDLSRALSAVSAGARANGGQSDGTAGDEQ